MHKKYLNNGCTHIIFKVGVILIMSDALRGSYRQKWSKLSNFCFLLKKCLQVWGHYVPIFRGLAALKPTPKWGAKWWQRGRGGRFFVFNRKRKRKWEKYFVPL